MHASPDIAPFLRTPPTVQIPDRHLLGQGDLHLIDHDDDLGFQLRGHSYNPLVDAALPLFGLVIRMRTLHEHDGVSELYQSVRQQIVAIGEEVRHLGYDHATLLAYRYCLCTFVDEAAMGATWGARSSWAERSLLSVFHDETWGGEKFYALLERMRLEPGRYRELLEFMYLCLCLGFKGRYGAEQGGIDALQRLIAELHQSLRELRGDAPERLFDAAEPVTTHRFRMRRLWPVWSPWAAVAIVLTGIYAAYAWHLSHISQQALQSLERILSL